MKKLLPATLKKIDTVFGYALTGFTCFSALFFLKVFCRGKIVNEAAIKRNLSRGFVLACNHVSYLDWLFLYGYFLFYHRRVITVIGKDKVFRHPLWRYVTRTMGAVRVSDEGVRFASHKDYKRLLNARFVAIFPEATRSLDGNLGTTHGGAIKIASRKQVPLIPVRLEGFYRVLPKGSMFPVPHRCRIVVGQECHYSMKHVENASDRDLDHCMYQVLNELRYVPLNCAEDPAPLSGAA